MEGADGSNSGLGKLGHFANSGATLTGYFDQLSRERNSITLKFRRDSYFSIGLLLKRNLADTKPRVLQKDSPFLQPEKAIEAISSCDESQISLFLKSFISCVQSNYKSTQRLAQNESFIEAFPSLFSLELSPDTTLSLYQVTAIIFDQTKFKQQIVDSDIVSTLAMQIYDQGELIMQQIALIGAISAASSYGRDALFCFGVHTTLIEIAGKEDASEELKEAATKCLCLIFGAQGPLDSDIIKECIGSIFALLEGAQPPVVQAIFGAFIEITNKVPETVFTLYSLGLFPFVVQCFQVPELVTISLGLCGNLTVSQPIQVSSFLDLGLFDILVGLLGTEDASHALWVMSNMLECIPHKVLPNIPLELVLEVIKGIEDGNSEYKQEAAFFVGTIILVSGVDIDKMFMRQEVIDLLVEMLGCGIYYVTLRCVEALQRIALTAVSTDSSAQLAEVINNSDFNDRIEDLNESDDNNLKELLLSLQKAIDDLTTEE